MESIDSLAIARMKNELMWFLSELFRSAKHLAVHDAGPHRRLMRRIQIAGDRPV